MGIHQRLGLLMETVSGTLTAHTTLYRHRARSSRDKLSPANVELPLTFGLLKIFCVLKVL